MQYVRMFKYRIYPTPAQVQILNKNISECCSLYNHLLELKIQKYKNEKKSLQGYDLNKIITELRKEHPELKEVHSQVLQNLSDRIQKAFDNFFRRVKEKKSGKKIKVGYPRFKSARRYKSITYPQSGFEFVSGKLRVSKIGDIKIKLHREIKGTVKTLTIKKTATGKWFAVFSCTVEIGQIQHLHPNNQVGIDVGLDYFACLSDGRKIENPRFLAASERRLAKLQRCLSRKKKDSANRGRARLKVARIHEKIACQRADFSHKLSRFFVQKYGRIAVEDLNILNMVRHPYLAKSINDASWGQFFRNLAYKAEEAGCEFVKVSPKGTTIECSRCHAAVPKLLAIRWHRCPNCGLVMDRDINAAKNILVRATAGTAGSHACREGSPLLNASFEVSPSLEAGSHNLNSARSWPR